MACTNEDLKHLLISIDDVPELNKDNIHIKNKVKLLEKLNKIINDGHKRLQIVTDFDHTLTRHNMDNGKTVLTSFAMFRECPSISQYYKDEEIRLASYYKPIEDDPVMSIEEKIKHMIDWYQSARQLLKAMMPVQLQGKEIYHLISLGDERSTEPKVCRRNAYHQAHDLLVSSLYLLKKIETDRFFAGVKFPKEELTEVGHKMVECFRIGVKELISWSQRHDVPVLVFSAGLGESVVAALEAANFLLPNVKVVSNFLEIDESGTIIGMKGDVIHTYNKNETAIKGTEYYEMVQQRHNVLLMGDNIGDAGMAAGMGHCEVVIKIGFVGRNSEPNLQNYIDKFDIVLVNDSSMDVANAILKLVL